MLKGIFAIALISMTSVFANPYDQLEEKEKELSTIRFLLRENQRPEQSYSVRYQGKAFEVYPNVFSPRVFPDTYFFADHITIRPGESFLEIGSGTGLIAIMAALRGAGKVTAVDINPTAVTNTMQNVMRHEVKGMFKVLEGDIFDSIAKREKFDTIFWFAPMMHVDMDRRNLSLLEKSVFDPNYEGLRRYLSEAREYLKPNGRLLLGYSPSHGEVDVLRYLAEKNGWEILIIAKEKDELPWFPGVDQVDAIDVMLIQLVNPSAVKTHSVAKPKRSAAQAQPASKGSQLRRSYRKKTI